MVHVCMQIYQVTKSHRFSRATYTVQITTSNVKWIWVGRYFCHRCCICQSVGFESNLQKNSERKKGKYAQLDSRSNKVNILNLLNLWTFQWAVLAFLQRSVRHSWKCLMISALNTITKNTVLNEWRRLRSKQLIIYSVAGTRIGQILNC